MTHRTYLQMRIKNTRNVLWNYGSATLRDAGRRKETTMGAGWLSQAMEKLIPIHQRGTLFPSLPVIPAAARNGVVFKVDYNRIPFCRGHARRMAWADPIWGAQLKNNLSADMKAVSGPRGMVQRMRRRFLLFT